MDILHDKFIKTIDQYGVVIIGVGCGFTYSIGMAQYNLPDLIITGDDLKMAHWLINAACDDMRKNGFKEGVNKRIAEHKSGAPMAMYFEFLEPSKRLVDECVCQAINFYVKNKTYTNDSNGFAFAQLMWPDNESRFPFEHNYSQEQFEQEYLGKFLVEEDEVTCKSTLN